MKTKNLTDDGPSKKKRKSSKNGEFKAEEVNQSSDSPGSTKKGKFEKFNGKQKSKKASIKSDEKLSNGSDPQNVDDGVTEQKISKSGKFENKANGKSKNATGKSKTATNGLPEKPEDWAEFKKKKKELRMKRKQQKDGFDITVTAKNLVDKIRRKTATPVERNIHVNKLHNLLKGHYCKFAKAHDTSRSVQCVLKYGSTTVRNDVSNEIMSIVIDMVQSKYGRHIAQRMLKHGQPKIRASVIKALYGHAVKLASHSVGSSILEYAFSTWATPLQKQHLVQEFYGDMYKNSKDDNVKHMRDVYATSPDLKKAVLSSVKENLSRIMTKKLFDSGIVQTLLHQYLAECSEEDRAEFITQIAPHIVIISNSKEGSRASMQCIWHGSNKDRKVAMKALKEHLVDLCKHEHGHCVIITLLDTADDTVLLHKIILSKLLANARELAQNEWGRKVLLWLVAPADHAYFHPKFVCELEEGKKVSTSKKPTEIRRKELLQYAVSPLIELVKTEPEFWLGNSSLALEMLGILKSAVDNDLTEIYESICTVICNPEWKFSERDTEIYGIEHPGMHMVLKKLAQHDKIKSKTGQPTFGKILIDNISSDAMKLWIQYNRGCFLLVSVLESNDKEVQNLLSSKLQKYASKLKKNETAGAKILLNKIT